MSNMQIQTERKGKVVTKSNDTADSTKGDIAMRLRETRNARELSQTALADKSGISRSSIVHYENANAVPGGLELLKLAKALGVSPNRILTGSDTFEESDAVEHVLAVENESIRVVRMALLMQSLDRDTRERVSALIVDMVRQRKSDSEFRAVLEMLDRIEDQFVEPLMSGIENLANSLNLEAITEQAETIEVRTFRAE